VKTYKLLKTGSLIGKTHLCLKTKKERKEMDVQSLWSLGRSIPITESLKNAVAQPIKKDDKKK